MTKLTASTTAQTQGELVARIERAQQLGAEAIEVRLDYLTEQISYARIVKACGVPIIWTNRHQAEGGKFEGSEDKRIDQLLAAIEVGGDYIDIEEQFWSADDSLTKRVNDKLAELRAGGRQIKLILSYHNFSAVPDDLSEIVDRISQAGADVVKFAVFANDIFDNFTVFEAIKACKKPVIGLAMGPAGRISRILAKKLGCELTFAALDSETASAPGQLTITQLKDDYNWAGIGPETKVLGVVGHPIEHSLSPQMHNAAYRQMKFDAVYLRFDVPGEYQAFERFVDKLTSADYLNALGLSVTIPHKLNAIDYVKNHSGRIDGLAEYIGAVNTLGFWPEGRADGINSDEHGFITALTEGASILPETLKGKRVAVLGSGGVSRTIVAAMKAHGASVTIYNRTLAKAQALADRFECQYRPWQERADLDADIVINGTSIGMWPNVDQSPLEESCIKSGMIVFDTVYNPSPTKLLELAQGNGATTVDGVSMLVHQGIVQIDFWTQCFLLQTYHVPQALMRDAVLNHLELQRKEA